MLELALQQIRKEEGLRLTPYLDTVGKLTIGYGRNLDDRGISLEEAESMLARDVRETVEEISHYPWFKNLSPRRQAALVNLHFNVGRQSFSHFYRMIAALAVGDWQGAANEVINSRYATQVPNRAQRIYDSLVLG